MAGAGADRGVYQWGKEWIDYSMEELQEMVESSGKMLPPDGQAVVTDQDEAARIYKRIDVIV